MTRVIWQRISTLCVVDGMGVVGVRPWVLVVMGLGRRAGVGWEPRWIAYAEVWGGQHEHVKTGIESILVYVIFHGLVNTLHV